MNAKELLQAVESLQKECEAIAQRLQRQNEANQAKLMEIRSIRSSIALEERLLQALQRFLLSPLKLIAASDEIQRRSSFRVRIS